MRNLVTIGVIALLPLFGCGLIPLQTAGSGGSGTETTNGIVGRAFYPDGTPAAGALVRARKADYLPDTLPGAASGPAAGCETMTDDTGAFTIDSIDTGNFSIEINDRQSNAALLTCVVANPNSTVRIASATLRTTGTIRGVVSLTDNYPGSVYVFVHGLERVARTDPATGSYSLPDMPSGDYTLAITAASTNTTKVLSGVIVTRGQTTVLDAIDPPASTGWAFSKILVLNTTSSGANIAGLVTGFPLLVRLTATNFNFTTARSDGADLRFTKAGGMSLPYEIERWDPVAKHAEVWVKVDTIFGNNRKQSLMMHWGNPSAAAVSSGAAVFDSAGGFQGVWHLADDAPAPTVMDATGKNNGSMMSGTAKLNTSSICSEGVVGKAAGFGGDSVRHWIDLGSNKAFINNKRELTVSCWIYADVDTFESGDLISISKGYLVNPQVAASRVSLSANTDKFLLSTTPGDSLGTYATFQSTQSYSLKTWIHVVAVVNVFTDSMFIYGNGRLWDAQAVLFVEEATSPSNSLTSAIGSNDLGLVNFFKGIIDEARIEGVARSPEWIRLNYENLKTGGKLIQ